MNVAFPGEGTHEAFWVIVGLMTGLGTALMCVFFWRRWL
jgi:Mg2+ and Co2+ transporter CorA